jgi:ribosomal protein S18 acetylase RimI-like enzyme
MNPLDNIIWHALTSRQTQFAQACGETRRFVSDVGPLAGFPAPSDKNYEALTELARRGNGTIALFLESPFQPRPGWRVIKGAPLIQMVRENGVEPDASLPLVQPLGAADNDEMIALATLTEPGPFGPRTRELGCFFGIRQQGKLVAMAGERMKVPGHTEISAVCTHPDHLGKGYAAALISKVMQGILQRGEIPFLHSRVDNKRAIELYTRLGFRERSLRHYVVLARK